MTETTVLELPRTATTPPYSLTPENRQSRIHYFDNLRAIAMLLGIYFHAALAYANPSQAIWLATDTRSSAVIDTSLWFFHLFRMSLFYVLAGYFAKLVIQQKGLKQFLKNRLLRIALPFVLSYPFLFGAMTFVFIFALSYLDKPLGIMGIVAEAIKSGTADQSKNPPSTMHLWFLYYLMVFSLIGAMFHRFAWWKLDILFRKPAWLLGAPLLLIPSVLLAGMPLPAPEKFVPELWPFCFYGLFFFTGWQIYGRESLLDQCRPYVWHIVSISCLLYVPYYFFMPAMNLELLSGKVQQQPWWQVALVATLTAYLSTSLTIASLVLGQRYLNSRSALLSFIADSSYWMYLIHLPLVLFWQTALIPATLPVIIKLLLVVIGTLIPCMMTYLVFVRYTPIGWLLHGKRNFP